MTETGLSTLELVKVKRKSLEDYRRISGDRLIDEIHQEAESLRGVRLLHINSTASGGGVAELLNSLVPLEIDCGLDVQWRLLCRDDELFEVTKEFHNALQGQDLPLGTRQKDVYLGRNRHCSQMFSPADYDVIFVHDPQPAAIAQFAGDRNTKWVWRCHIDSSQPATEVWDFLRPFIHRYHAAVFTMREFVPPDLQGPELHFIAPAIDPLSPKNRALPKYLCREEVGEFGVDLARPLLIQVSRFDPWKDPLGVIETYQMVKKELPQVQLALIGAMAEDDPQGWEIYNLIRKRANTDSDIHVFTNLTGVGAHEVNAFQRVADVVIQKSLREGFGLVVSEAIWKGTPVVAGGTGGIVLQMQDGIGGFLVDSISECAERVSYLLTHSDESESIARKGWERIRDVFLMPRLLLDHLKLMKKLMMQ